MSNIILIGMPASGKSTIGVVLAKTLGMSFVDTDLIIQSNQGKLLQNIIDDDGLETFLEIEQQAITELYCDNTVVATGGSAVLRKNAMEHLKSLGKIIYLYVECDVLEKRLDNIATRGIACKKGESACDIFKVRKPFYEEYADITIQTIDSSVEKTVEQILDNIK
ncbi:MAG: shikimate kinase [Clostridia bacterium]|nr:shikimate kinase [Clostridia bacterium]